MNIVRDAGAGLFLHAAVVATSGQELIRPVFPAGAVTARIWALSADGGTAVGQFHLAGATRPFVWTRAGGVQELSLLPGDTNGSALGVSADGLTIVGASRATGGLAQAVRWKSSQAEPLGFLPGGAISLAHATSADGSVVVGWSGQPPNEHAFRWTAGAGMEDLGTIASASVAMAVSHDGSVVTGYTEDYTGFARALRWSQSEDWAITDLGVLPGWAYSSASGINGDGTVVVGSSDMNGFRWTQETGLQQLPIGPFTGVTANGISADGTTIVGSGRVAAGHYRAVTWKAMSEPAELHAALATEGVNLSGWVLQDAETASADGSVIAGLGTFNGVSAPFIARFGPADCYPNCDGSSAAPALNVADFACFTQRFAAGDPYANCDQSIDAPTLNVADFTCFLKRFALGCP